MGRLTRDKILSAPDIVEKEIEIPEWGGNVLIRTLTKAQQIKLRKQAMTTGGKLDEEHLEILIFINGVVEPVFTEQDYDALRAKSASAMDLVLLEIYRGSGMAKEEIGQIDRSFPGGAS